MLTRIINGKIITTDQVIENGSVLIGEGKILAINEREFEDAEIIDAGGHYVSPGFIDIHVHGGNGHDFMDNSTEGFLEIARFHARHGTTAMFPTTLSCEKSDLLETLKVYEKTALLNDNGAQFMGIHLEGPYFAMSQRGAQDPRFIRNPDPVEYAEILSRSEFIKRWSAAPELPGAIEFGKYMAAHGVLPAIAHTDAIYEEVVTAYQAGYSLATHFYSAMSGVTRRKAYRYAGVVESAYLIDDMDVEIIADGKHLPAALLKLIYKIKGPKHIALITDAMRGAGMPPGESILGGIKNGTKVILEDEVAKMPDRTAFAGSVATFDLLLRNMINLAEVPILEAVRMASETPARIMKIQERKGSIEVGKDADLVIFDNNINILKTIIVGKVVYDGI